MVWLFVYIFLHFIAFEMMMYRRWVNKKEREQEYWENWNETGFTDERNHFTNKNIWNWLNIIIIDCSRSTVYFVHVSHLVRLPFISIHSNYGIFFPLRPTLPPYCSSMNGIRNHVFLHTYNKSTLANTSLCMCIYIYTKSKVTHILITHMFVKPKVWQNT